MDEENKSQASSPGSRKEASPVSVTSNDNHRSTNEDNSSSTIRSHIGNDNDPIELVTLQEEKSGDNMSLHQKSNDASGTVPKNKGETVKIPQKESGTSVKKEKSGAEPIIIPLILKMAEFDHKALLEEWISSRAFGENCPIQVLITKEKDRLITNLKTIQNYLCSFKSQGLTVVNILPTSFPQTLDWLHGYLLQCIEQGIQADPNEASSTPACGS